MKFSEEEKKGFSGVGSVYRKAHIGIDQESKEVSGWDEIMELIKHEDEKAAEEAIAVINNFANKPKPGPEPEPDSQPDT